jgi:hypothetical protein
LFDCYKALLGIALGKKAISRDIGSSAIWNHAQMLRTNAAHRPRLETQAAFRFALHKLRETRNTRGNIIKNLINFFTPKVEFTTFNIYFYNIAIAFQRKKRGRRKKKKKKERKQRKHEDAKTAPGK